MIGQGVIDDLSSIYSRPWRPKGPKKIQWIENLCGVLHGNKWILFHGPPHIGLGPSKRGRSDIKPRALAINKMAIGSLKYHYAMAGTWSCTYIVVSQRGPRSLHSKLDNPNIGKLDFYFPRYGLSMQGPLAFHGHMSWYVCKAVRINLVLNATYNIRKHGHSSRDFSRMMWKT